MIIMDGWIKPLSAAWKHPTGTSVGFPQPSLSEHQPFLAALTGGEDGAIGAVYVHQSSSCSSVWALKCVW